jgi:hypothetical protein
MRSFISEHTAEFFLVPRFRDLLSTGFAHVVPFFFWKTREGGSRSRAEVFPGPVSVCAMFPRRPKVQGQEIAMTVNPEVFAMSTELQQRGVPTFLGIPLVQAMSHLGADFRCLWFSTDSTQEEVAGFGVDCAGPNVQHSCLVGPLQDGWELCQSIRTSCKPRTWSEIIETLHGIHTMLIANQRFGYAHALYGPRYKPVYFLVW